MENERRNEKIVVVLILMVISVVLMGSIFHILMVAPLEKPAVNFIEVVNVTSETSEGENVTENIISGNFETNEIYDYAGYVNPTSAAIGANETAITTFTNIVSETTDIIARNGIVYDPVTAKVYEKDVSNISWNMTIFVTNQLEPVVIGIHPTATDGIDEFDEFTAMPLKEKVIMALDEIHAISIKQTKGYNESVTWDLLIGIPDGKTTVLNWEVPSMVNLTIAKECGQVIESGLELSTGKHRLLITTYI